MPLLTRCMRQRIDQCLEPVPERAATRACQNQTVWQTASSAAARKRTAGARPPPGSARRSAITALADTGQDF
eukprot:6207953-Pleurochrysis_carterae.AAC.1